MPVQIGAKTHNFTDPTGLLSDCHRRIEMFLETLAAAGKVMHEPPSDDTARALQAALVYFRQAAPKHTADEEESLFPRLRGREEAELRSALSTLDRLEKDHDTVSPLHAAVERLAETFLETGSLSASHIQAFQTGSPDCRRSIASTSAWKIRPSFRLPRVCLAIATSQPSPKKWPPAGKFRYWQSTTPSRANEWAERGWKEKEWGAPGLAAVLRDLGICELLIRASHLSQHRRDVG